MSVAAAILAAALALALPLAPGASAASYGGDEPIAWTNGLVLCQFSGTEPQVNVSALDLAGTGLLLSTMSVGEASPNGSMVATAAIAGAAWTVLNDSSDDAYVLAYSLHASLESASPSAADGAWSPANLGSADLAMTFVLPAYDGSADGATDAVNFSLTVANWSWQSAEDHLVVGFGARPSFPSSEELAAANVSGWLLTSSSTSTGAELERMGLSPTAAVVSAGGEASDLAANTTMVLAPETANLTVALSNAEGALSSATFSGTVGVVLPATIAGIPLSELVAAAGAAAAVSVLVALGARRVRRRPSRLIYVDEESGP